MKKSIIFTIALFVIGLFSACEEESNNLKPNARILKPSSQEQIIRGAEVKVDAQLNGFDLYHPVHRVELLLNDSLIYKDTSGRQNFTFLWLTEGFQTGTHQITLNVTYSDDRLNDKDWNFFNSRDYIEGENKEPDTLKLSESISVELIESPQSNVNIDFQTFQADTFNYNSKTIILSEFQMSTYEITNGQYCKFLNAIKADENGYYGNIKYLHLRNNEHITYSDGAFEPASSADSLLPVTNVTWTGAKNFCRWAGGRLPTETEWYYCVKDMNVNNLNDIAWYRKNSDNKIHTIGTKSPNANGLYDMLGNAAEWCTDWYTDTMYPSAADTLTNPIAPHNQTAKVYRGGHWNSKETQVAIDTRFRESPKNGGNFLGFRMVIPTP